MSWLPLGFSLLMIDNVHFIQQKCKTYKNHNYNKMKDKDIDESTNL